MYLLSLPLAGFLTYNTSRLGGGANWFLGAMGAFPILSYMGTSRIAVNQFGYTGGGFRRFFLLPTRSRARACAPPVTHPCTAGRCDCASHWDDCLDSAGAGRVGSDAKSWMLAGSAITGLFLFNGLGIWSTLFGPRKGNYASAMGNDLSLMGNLVVFSCMLGGLFLPMVLKKWAPALVSPGNWWVVLPPAAIAVTFYFVSLNLAGPLVHERRERLMAVVEGKN